MSITPEQSAALRKPFDRATIGLLPKVSCGACTNVAKTARTARDKHCERHTVRECPACHNYITTGHLHLDYVGHAAVTDRLLAVDPAWTWEFATPDDLAAVPAAFRDGGLWIRLTVLGVARLGFGDAQGKTGPNATKEAIGDALRNAAMRFGVALDLWSKDELEGVSGHVERPSDDVPREAPEPMTTKTRGRMFALLAETGIVDEAVQRAGMAKILGREVHTRSDLTEAEARQVIASLEARS